jgi:hypothetical protein
LVLCNPSNAKYFGLGLHALSLTILRNSLHSLYINAFCFIVGAKIGRWIETASNFVVCK